MTTPMRKNKGLPLYTVVFLWLFIISVIFGIAMLDNPFITHVVALLIGFSVFGDFIISKIANV